MNVVPLITQMATSDQRVGRGHSVDTPDREMIRLPGGTQRDSKILHHNTQNSAQFKIINYLFLVFSI